MSSELSMITLTFLSPPAGVHLAPLWPVGLNPPTTPLSLSHLFFCVCFFFLPPSSCASVPEALQSAALGSQSRSEDGGIVPAAAAGRPGGAAEAQRPGADGSVSGREQRAPAAGPAPHAVSTAGTGRSCSVLCQLCFPAENLTPCYLNIRT